MSITTTYNYSSGTGFVYDPTRIGFLSSMAQLLLGNNPGQSFVPSISASTYDPALLEYVSGSLRQKDQRPANATYYAAWTSQLNANWSGPGNGSLVINAFNGAAQTGGVLDLTGTSSKYVNFNPTGNMDSLLTGTVEFQYIPGYSGSPATPQVLLNLAIAEGGSSQNFLDIEHFTDGKLYFFVYDAAAAPHQITVNPWAPTSGVTYTIRCTFDANNGDMSIYIDGVQVATAVTGGFSRVGPIGYGVIGRYFDDSGGNANFSMKNLSWYSTVTTPSSPVLFPTIYAGATGNLPLFTYSGIGAVQAFTAFSGTESGSPHYILNNKYWNGSAWVASNGTYAQSNALAAVNSSISSLPVSNTLQIDVIYQAENSPQASVSSITMTYTGQIYPTSDPSIYPNVPLSMDDLSSFIAVLSSSGSDGVQFYLKIGSSNYWWDGSAWSTSSGAYAQSNTAATINTHSGSLPISDGAFVTPIALLHSASGTTTPMLTSLTLVYDYFGPEPTPPGVCKVFGYVLDENEVPISGAIVSVTNPTTFFNGDIAISQGVRTARTSSIGYWSMNLVETESLSTPQQYVFQITYTQTQVGTGFTPVSYSFGSAVIPNSPEANFADLTFE